jgi:hypothetical protein
MLRQLVIFFHDIYRQDFAAIATAFTTLGYIADLLPIKLDIEIERKAWALLERILSDGSHVRRVLCNF